MSLISLAFLVFCTAVLILYYLMPRAYRWTVLLAASLLFYCICGGRYIIYVLVTATTVYLTARLLDDQSQRRDDYLALHKEELGREEKKAYKQAIKSRQKRLLFLCVFLNAGILFVIKYADYFVAYFNYYRLTLTGNINYVPQPGLILPLGMSFYTFQTLGYLIDVYYGRVKSEKNYFRFLLFTSFFPQIVQGPISRFADLAPELFAARQFDADDFKYGLLRIAYGLFKKLVIADRLASYVSTISNLREYYSGLYLLLGIFFYAFQIYGDFSGGIDVTIGVARLFGIKLTDNFDRPFFSKSIAEYWRRWHITLGTWFRDYVFYPLSVNKTVLNIGKWVRTHVNEAIGKRVAVYLPMIAVWTLTGMWHGSQSKFVVWGLLNCFFLILGTEFEPLSVKLMDTLGVSNDSLIVKLYRIFKTFWLMSFLRVFDLVRTPSEGFSYIRNIFRSWRGFDLNEVYGTLQLPREELIIAVIAILVLTCISTIQRKHNIREIFLRKNAWVQYFWIAAMLAVVMIFGSYGLGYDAQSFIYMKF